MKPGHRSEKLCRRKAAGKIWSRRQGSNLYPTLRRHVHYPLCYGETHRDESGDAIVQHPGFLYECR